MFEDVKRAYSTIGTINLFAKQKKLGDPSDMYDYELPKGGGLPVLTKESRQRLADYRKGLKESKDYFVPNKWYSLRDVRANIAADNLSIVYTGSTCKNFNAETFAES